MEFAQTKQFQRLNMNYSEMTIEQRRQLIDTQQAFASWRPAAMELERLGTMRVQTSHGQRYMYEAHSTVRKSLGRETPELQRRKAEHDKKKAELQKREKALRKRLDAMAPVNKALGTGGMRTIAARIVRALDRENLLGTHVIVAGTNALHAYEAATGTIISQQHVATTDADILWDTRQSLLLAATGIRREGLMGILRRVDKSFAADFGYNATNRDGYIVDLLCPETDDITTMNAGADLEAVAMSGAQWLLAAPQFERTIVAEDGWPLRIVVPEPRTFALHKLWVSQRDDRDAIKRPRDTGHAAVVSELVRKYLGQKFLAKEMPWLPSDLRALLKHLK
jgi:hypothetical protein